MLQLSDVRASNHLRPLWNGPGFITSFYLIWKQVFKGEMETFYLKLVSVLNGRLTLNIFLVENANLGTDKCEQLVNKNYEKYKAFFEFKCIDQHNFYYVFLYVFLHVWHSKTYFIFDICVLVLSPKNLLSLTFHFCIVVFQIYFLFSASLIEAPRR